MKKSYGRQCYFVAKKVVHPGFEIKMVYVVSGLARERKVTNVTVNVLGLDGSDTVVFKTAFIDKVVLVGQALISCY